MPVAFSAKAQAEFDQIVARYPVRSAALLPALHLAQREFGWISPEVKVLLSRALDVAPARVDEVVTFYTMYRKEPPPQWHLELCTNTSCQLNGADHLLACALRKLGIPEGTHRTADGRIEVEEVECLASCGTAPAMQLNGESIENLDEALLNAVLDRINKP